MLLFILSIPAIPFLCPVKIAPSLLSADFGKLREDIEMMNESEADRIHVDVMDGRFVPNISFGFPVMNVLTKYARKPLDLHLMIVEPEKYAEAFVKAGAHYLSFHIEATDHAHRLLDQVRSFGAKPGIAINPQTGIDWLPSLAGGFDFVNVMTVNPGFGGQSFIRTMEEKLERLNGYRLQYGFETEIDGGVTFEVLESLKSNLPDVAVAGSSVFSAPNPKEEIARLTRSF